MGMSGRKEGREKPKRDDGKVQSECLSLFWLLNPYGSGGLLNS